MEALKELKEADVPPFKQGEDLDCVIAHWVQYAPGRSGMYETVKELVKYENKQKGVLAGIVEPMEKPDCKAGGKIDPIETDVVTQSWNWAFTQATVHMIHFTQLPLIARMKPRIFMIHGSLEASLYSELDPSQHKFASLSVAIQLINTCDASIAIHKRQYDNYKQFDFSNKLSYVRRGVDLERWRPQGAKMNLDGAPRVLYGEQWRHQKDPLLALYSMYELRRRNKEAKLHVYNCEEYRDTWQEVMFAGRFHELLGKYQLAGHQTFPEHWYRGCDMTINPGLMGEDSRVTIESLACGTPVVGWDTNPWNDYVPTRTAKAFDPVSMAGRIQDLHEDMKVNGQKIRRECVKYARDNFDMNYTAQAVVKICRNIQEVTK